MPYVPQKRREQLRPPRYTGKAPADMASPGDLAFLLAATVTDYIEEKGLSWQVISDVLGALEGVSRDFWTHVGQPYENVKRQENGRIYTPVPS